MSAAPKNILIGIGAVFVIGCGGLGYLISSTGSQLADLRQTYETESGKYNRLRGLPLYPSAANLKLLDEQKEVAIQAAESLRKKLEPMVVPLEEITPEQFQDKLRASVSALVSHAQEVGVALPEKFYLGFDQYQSQPPKAEAAAPLWRQLKAMEFVVTTLIDSKVDAVTAIERTPLPEEASSKPQPQQLVAAFPFKIGFTADQPNFRKGFNEIVRNNRQFFITRSLVVKNSNEKTTPKAQADPNPAGAEGEEKKEANLAYIVGTEKVNVSLGLEMVVFANAFPK